MTKNILIFTHAGGNSQLGPNARWARFAKGLKENDINLTVIGASYFHKYRKVIKAKFMSPYEMKIDDLSFIYIWSPMYIGSIMRLLNQLIYSISIFLLKKKHLKKNNPDFIIASSPHPFIVFGAYFWAKTLKANFVYESRDLWPMLLNQNFGMSKLNPYSIMCCFSEYFAISKASFVITPKQNEFKYYSNRYNYKNVIWVPNTSKKRFIRPLHSKSDSSTSMTILYAGSLDTIYLIDELIEAVKIINQTKIKLLILGEGRKKKHLRSIAKNSLNIRFIGWVHGNAYFKYLANADICFFGTSNMEINKYGFSSNKISDYLSLGKPILAHCVDGIDHLVSSGVALQSKPGDIKCLANNIRLLWSKRKLLDQMSKKASDYYSKHYDYDNVIKKLIKVFK